jgi:hypothetical protein
MPSYRSVSSPSLVIRGSTQAPLQAAAPAVPKRAHAKAASSS